MSAENTVKELRFGVSRRRVKRGFMWLLKNAGPWYLPAQAASPKVFIPELEEWQKEHILAQAFQLQHEWGQWCEVRTEWTKHVWSDKRRKDRMHYDDVVTEFSLSEWFLTSHGFLPCSIINVELLHNAWEDALWEQNYVHEYVGKHFPPEKSAVN